MSRGISMQHVYVYKYLKDHPGYHTADQIISITGVNRTVVYRALDKFNRADIINIIKVQPYRYSITEASDNVLVATMEKAMQLLSD